MLLYFRFWSLFLLFFFPPESTHSVWTKVGAILILISSYFPYFFMPLSRGPWMPKSQWIFMNNVEFTLWSRYPSLPQIAQLNLHQAKQLNPELLSVLPAPQAMPVLHIGRGGHDQPAEPALCVHTSAQASRNLGEETAVPRLPFGIGAVPTSHQSRVNSESKDGNFYFSRSRARMSSIIKIGITLLEVMRE